MDYTTRLNCFKFKPFCSECVTLNQITSATHMDVEHKTCL